MILKEEKKIRKMVKEALDFALLISDNKYKSGVGEVTDGKFKVKVNIEWIKK